MDKIYWAIGNAIALATAVIFAYITSISGQASPIVTPTASIASEVITTTSSNLIIKTLLFPTQEEANSAFITQFPDANVDTLVTNDLQYQGYYAWYDNTATTHIVLKRKLEITTLSFTNTGVLTKDRESFVKETLLAYLERK